MTQDPQGSLGADAWSVTAWIRHHAHPLETLDPHAPLTDLQPLAAMAGDATVVGLARGTHGGRELSTLTHRVLRFLVEHLGFRSLAIEEDWTTGVEIDDHLRTGEGALRALLGNAFPQWRNEEVLDVLRWMRSYNMGHPGDPVRLVGLDVSSDAGLSMDDVEARLAENLIRWHEHTGAKILYWSGSHSAVGHDRSVVFGGPATGPPSRNAGSYLREHLGSTYLSAGVLFHHGSAPGPVPAPAKNRPEDVFARSGLNTYLLDLRADRPIPVRAWLDTPAKMRLIGPGYDPENDATHHMSGGSLADWFDLVIFRHEVSPTRPVGEMGG